MKLGITSYYEYTNVYNPYQILSSFNDSPTILGGYSLKIITEFCLHV